MSKQIEQQLTLLESQIVNIKAGNISKVDAVNIITKQSSEFQNLYNKILSLYSDEKTPERPFPMSKMTKGGLRSIFYISKEEGNWRKRASDIRNSLALLRREFRISIPSSETYKLTARTALSSVDISLINSVRAHFDISSPKQFISLRKLSVATDTSGNEFKVLRNTSERMRKDKDTAMFKTVIAEYAVDWCKSKGVLDVKINSKDVISFTNSVIKNIFKCAVQ